MHKNKGEIEWLEFQDWGHLSNWCTSTGGSPILVFKQVAKFVLLLKNKRRQMNGLGEEGCGLSKQRNLFAKICSLITSRPSDIWPRQIVARKQCYSRTHRNCLCCKITKINAVTKELAFCTIPLCTIKLERLGRQAITLMRGGGGADGLIN